MSEARDRMLAQTSSSIFGGSSEPQQASRSSVQSRQPEFEPKYPEYNGRTAYLKSIYGEIPQTAAGPRSEQPAVDLGFYGGNRPASSQIQSSPGYGKRKSETFYQRSGDSPGELKHSPPSNPSDARSHQYASSVFGDQPSYQVSEQRHQITGQYDRNENELQKRYQNKNYSNLFDQEYGVPSTTSGSPDKLQASTTQWQNSATSAISRREYDEYNPKAFRGEQMRSILDSEVPKYTPPPPEPKINYDVLPERKPEKGATTFLISGLGPNDDEDQIRSKCRGVHFVSIKPEVNQISGKCTGHALVTVRGEGVERFRLNMAYSGWEVQEYNPDIGRHYEISNNEQWWQTEQKRPINSDLDAAQIR